MRTATDIRTSRSSAADRSQVYLELTKPRITLMVLLTVAVGFFAAQASAAPMVLLHVLIGTALACSGAGTLNQYIERDIDCSMDRTRFRPLPARRVSASAALALGASLSIGGVIYLALMVNPLSAMLNAITVASYLFVYTPMKRRTPLSTLAGAIPGALPPVIGWTAATGSIGAGAAVLFGILFLWQIPHFLAIGWMYRDDYERGGFPMLVIVDKNGDATARQMVIYSLVLIPVSLLLTATGAAGSLYFWCALLSGLCYFGFSINAARERTLASARRLLLCSVIYQPALFAALFLERALPPLRSLL